MPLGVGLPPDAERAAPDGPVPGVDGVRDSDSEEGKEPVMGDIENESVAAKFLREQAAIGRNQRKEPVEGTSGVPLARLSQEAFNSAFEAFCDYLAVDFTAPEGHEATVEQFRRDADDYGWRFTTAGELIENDEEEEK